MSHIRAGYYLQKAIDKAIETKPNVQFKFNLKHYLMYVLILAGRFFFNKPLYSVFAKTRKFIWVFEQYKLEKTYQLYSKYGSYLHKFYIKNNIEERFKNNTLFKELIEE